MIKGENQFFRTRAASITGGRAKNQCPIISCFQVKEKVAAAAADEASTVSCPAGLCDTAVPVRLVDRLIGFLQTGQVFRKPPTRVQFERTLRLVAEWGVQVDAVKLEQALQQA